MVSIASLLCRCIDVAAEVVKLRTQRQLDIAFGRGRITQSKTKDIDAENFSGSRSLCSAFGSRAATLSAIRLYVRVQDDHNQRLHTAAGERGEQPRAIIIVWT